MLCASCISGEILQNSYSPQFELFTMPPGPNLADHVWLISVWIMDSFWTTTIVVLRAKIGRFSTNTSYPRLSTNRR